MCWESELEDLTGEFDMQGWKVIVIGSLTGWNKWCLKVTVRLIFTPPLADLVDDWAWLEGSICKAGLRGVGVIEGSQELGNSPGDVVLVFDLFEGEADLEDLWAGKLRGEGGAPLLGWVIPDLLDLILSSSLRFGDMLARLLLDPTVSTFVQPCYEGFTWVVGFRYNDEQALASMWLIKLQIGVETCTKVWFR